MNKCCLCCDYCKSIRNKTNDMLKVTLFQCKNIKSPNYDTTLDEFHLDINSCSEFSKEENIN